MRYLIILYISYNFRFFFFIAHFFMFFFFWLLYISNSVWKRWKWIEKSIRNLKMAPPSNWRQFLNASFLQNHSINIAIDLKLCTDVFYIHILNIIYLLLFNLCIVVIFFIHYCFIPDSILICFFFLILVNIIQLFCSFNKYVCISAPLYFLR